VSSRYHVSTLVTSVVASENEETVERLREASGQMEQAAHGAEAVVEARCDIPAFGEDDPTEAPLSDVLIRVAAGYLGERPGGSKRVAVGRRAGGPCYVGE